MSALTGVFTILGVMTAATIFFCTVEFIIDKLLAYWEDKRAKTPPYAD